MLRSLIREGINPSLIRDGIFGLKFRLCLETESICLCLEMEFETEKSVSNQRRNQSVFV